MKRLSVFSWILTITVMLLGASGVNATILTFSDMGLTDFDLIPQEYGDNVTATADIYGSYLEGNGFTAGITTSYRTLNGAGDSTVFENHLEYWSSGYGDLFGVAFASKTLRFAEITLTADAGSQVLLNSFDVGGWNFTDKPNQQLRFYDIDYNLLLDLTPQFVEGNNGHTFIAVGLQSNVIRIQWGNDWNVGIDNINFDQIAVVDGDEDGDGVPDGSDACPGTAANDPVGVFGCSQAQVDSDGDGVCNTDAPAGAGGPPPGCSGSDACPDTPQGEMVNADGCSDTQLDTDNDGVTDAEDNCPLVFNDGQEDLDGDDVGDVCDDDIDGDNILNDDDNCRINANEDQADNDLDTIGDVCDPDDDNDNVLDGDDNCPINANEDQADNDLDSIGDVCDPDDDNDSVDDDFPDNCPFDANPNREDADSDGLGDVCDPDDDNDGVADGDDVCPATVIPEGVPTSSRGLGKNRWTLDNPDGSFTQGPPQAGRMFSFTTADTRGCSCEQIIDGLGLGKGHSKYGCSNGAMIDWANMQQ